MVATLLIMILFFNALTYVSCSGVMVPSYSVQNKPASVQKSTRTEISYQRRSDDDFVQRSSRLAFTRKVYAIFLSQMATTVAVTGIIMNNHDLAYFLLSSAQKWMVGSAICSYAVLFALIGNSRIRLQFPINVILLGIYTILQSITIGMFSLFFDPKLFCLGSVHTLVAFAAITLYSFQPNPKLDLTSKGAVLLTSLFAVTVGSFLGIFFKMPLLDNLLSAALAIIFASYIAYDTQMIVGGKHHKHAYGKDEYILAALNLYQDVINLFMQIMKLLRRTASTEDEY